MNGAMVTIGCRTPSGSRPFCLIGLCNLGLFRGISSRDVGNHITARRDKCHMLTYEEPSIADLDAGVALAPAALAIEPTSILQRAFGVAFSLVDGNSGDVLRKASGQPSCDWQVRGELCREVARRGRPELIDDDDPWLTLAIPIVGDGVVAVGSFLARPITEAADVQRAAEMLGMRLNDVCHWVRTQPVWTADALGRLAELVLDDLAAHERTAKLRCEVDSLSINLSSTYEEISLLYRLTQNLRLSKSDEDLARVALEWMREVVPASGLVIQLVPVPGADKSLTHTARTRTVLLCHGDCPIDSDKFSELIAHLGVHPGRQPTVVNRPITEQRDWPSPQIRQVIAVALTEGDNVFGWLAALNHVEGGEFGTVEASLLSSVAAILGIHSGNIELYRQQSELLAGIVRALTSAIDAKDPYTCGHSDRVARVAVRLAEELNCDGKMLNMLYLAGLLHDVGKIGVSDSVLRKDGKLSDAEYEHIKQHVTIGHRILNDLAKLEDVLPVVLYHHESWDGAGYPEHRRSQTIPLPARIVAVADAFDAMSSDRPYRKGMPEERVDQILREGAGQQWDPDVIAAFFRARRHPRNLPHRTATDGYSVWSPVAAGRTSTRRLGIRHSAWRSAATGLKDRSGRASSARPGRPESRSRMAVRPFRA